MTTDLARRSNEWKAALAPLARTILVGVPLALLSFIALLLVSGGPASDAGSEWVTESVFAAVTATTWMAVGLLAGRPTRSSALILFGIGAVASWMLTLKIVHSVSVYYGMTQFVTACAAGIIAGTAILRWRASTSLLPWIAGAVGIVTLGIAWQLWTDVPGDGRRLRDAAGVQHRVGVFGWSGSEAYVWVPRGAVLPPRTGEPVEAAIEFDPGSGHRAVFLTPVTDPSVLAAAGRAAAAHERTLIAGDIERGSVPAMFRRAPVPVRMREGTTWRIDY